MDNPEKPLFAANASRSNAWSPIATATRGDDDDPVEMMPKGMFASEKCEPRGMLNQDLREVIVMLINMLACFSPPAINVYKNRRLVLGRDCDSWQIANVQYLVGPTCFKIMLYQSTDPEPCFRRFAKVVIPTKSER